VAETKDLCKKKMMNEFVKFRGDIIRISDGLGKEKEFQWSDWRMIGRMVFFIAW
jgi:hypothetical protein